MAGQNRSGSRKQSTMVAFCGMMVALSVALMLTGGSTSVRQFEDDLRVAGATARALLLKAAARRC